MKGQSAGKFDKKPPFQAERERDLQREREREMVQVAQMTKHSLLTARTKVRPPRSTVVVCERVWWSPVRTDTWVF